VRLLPQSDKDLSKSLSIHENFFKKNLVKLAAAVNRNRSSGGKKRLAFTGGFHRGGISGNKFPMPLPKRAMALLKARRLLRTANIYALVKYLRRQKPQTRMEAAVYLAILSANAVR